MSDENKKTAFQEASGRYDMNDPATWRTMPREELKKILDEGIKIPKRGGGFYTFKTQPVNPFIEARKRKFQKG